MSKNILIIDDDNEFTTAISRLLEARGYTITCAEDGGEGIKKAEVTIPDLILLDIMMKGRTEGIEVSKKLKANSITAAIPIIILTGIRKEMNVPYSFEPDNTYMPVKAILEKPIKPDELIQMIEKIL